MDVQEEVTGFRGWEREESRTQDLEWAAVWTAKCVDSQRDVNGFKGCDSEESRA